MFEIYMVKEGDTIESIAKKFNADTEEIYKINNFLPLAQLKVGDKVIIPLEKKTAFNYYEIKEGDTLYNIANRFKTNAFDLAVINGLDVSDYIYKDQIILVPKEGYIFTITKNGDTLESVSQRLNTTVGKVLLQNPDVYLLEEQLITYNTAPIE